MKLFGIKPYLRIALIFFVISVVWIIVSDKFIFLISGEDITIAERLQTVKGLAFITLTTFIIYFLTRQAFLEQQNKNLEIQKSEVLFKSLFKHLPLPTYLWKVEKNDFILVDFNDTAKNISYGEVVEYIGATPQELYPKNPLILKNLIECRTSKKNIITEIEYKFRDSDKIKNLLVNYIFIPNDMIMVHTEDITDRKTYQENLKAAKEKAEKSDNLKSEFLAQVSHEIRTPLNTMLSFASLIREEIEDKLDEDLRTSFSMMENAGKRIIRTIELILNLSEVHAGTINVAKKEVEVFPILEDILGLYYQQAKSKELKIELVHSNNCKVLADEYMLYQIFENLIDNAVKYTPRGTIKIKSQAVKDQLFVVITDTGIGIAEDFIPMLFTPFSQEDQGYTRRYEGNGLGLSLVKKYCELNDAEISVESEKGKGSKFSILFKNCIK